MGIPTESRSSRGALVAAIVILMAYSCVLLLIGIGRTGFQQLYNLDDTYIHLAISRNLAFNHVWGLNPNEFSGASSSPLWTVLLAGVMKLFGPRVWLPLALNIIMAPLVIVGLWSLLRPYVRSPKLMVVALVVIGAWIPIPMLIMNSMEQTIQIALVLGMMLAFAKLYAGADGERKSRGWTATVIWGMLLTALAVGARFESLFVVFVGCGLLVLRRRFLAAILLGAAAWVPVGLYAAYSIHHGGTYLPYSVLVKGNHLDSLAPAAIVSWLRQGVIRQMKVTLVSPVFASAVLLLAMLGRNRKPAAHAARFLLLVFIGSTLLHGQFALLLLLYRYEAYLFALGGVAVFAGLAVVLSSEKWTARPQLRHAIVGLFIVINLPTLIRPALTDVRMIAGARNIQQQQIQMGRFVHQFYAHQSVALNDIGAVAWLGDAHVTDLWGLADRKVFELRRYNKYSSAGMAQVCRDEHADIAIVYPIWYVPYGGVPKEWKIMGIWTMPPTTSPVSPNTVVFYATRPEAEQQLAESLAAFEAEEPKLYGVARHDGQAH